MRDSKHRITFLVSAGLLLASTIVVSAERCAAQGSNPQLTTLYSPNKYPNGYGNQNPPGKFCVLFQAPERNVEPCDLFYGYLYAGDEWDWFQSSAALHNRSVIKDLGAYSWTDSFKVEPVEPLPKLKPGEQRSVSIDTSGADGAPGAPGAPGHPGQPGADADGIVRNTGTVSPPSAPMATPSPPAKPRHDGKPRIDPLFVKAVIGHMYVIHVVDDFRDFYVLFRVEKLERGDNCTVSWQFIPAPENAKRPQE